MTEGELLYAILCLIYLSECAHWTRRGSVALRSIFGGRPRPAFPHPVLGNRRGGLLFVNPVPLGPLYLSRLPCVSYSPEGVLPYVTPAPDPGPREEPTGRFLRWEEVETVSEHDGRVEINGAPFVVAARGEGREVAERITALAEAAPDAREAEIQSRIAKSADVRAVEARVAECELATRNLGLTTSLLFVWLFAGIPLIATRFGVDSTWRFLLLGLYVATATNHLVFWRAHRRLYPDDRRGRQKALLLMIAAPPAAIRACDAVTAPLLKRFHPLAAAAALSGDVPLRSLAKAVLRDTAHPRADRLGAVPAEARAPEDWFRRRLLAALSAAVRTRGLDPGELLSPDPRRDEAAVAACPRCGTEFLRTDVACEDCGGRALVLIGASASAPVDSAHHDGA